MSPSPIANGDASTATTHILVFPYPAQGHMLPLLDLTHKLVLQGLHITILVTPKNLPILNTLLSTHPNSIQTLILPFPRHPKLPLGIENVKDIGNSGNSLIMGALSMLEREVIQWFQSHTSPPQAILSDSFLGYTHHWAEKLNIPRIAFYSSGAFFNCVHESLWFNVNKERTLDIVDFPGVPRLPSFPWEHLPSMFKRYKEGDSDLEIVKEGILANSKAWRCVFNSFYALEGEYLNHMEKEWFHEKVYSVGPLHLVDKLASIRNSPKANYDALDWLDNCPDGSVLYVCFGSQKLLKKAQMKALALGLERSKTRFVWIVNSAASLNMPDGFEERITGQGLIIRGWVPQAEILAHTSVGGFMSHCGWNSLLESMVAGVMILAWPMEADQFANAKLLVEYAGLAVRLCEGDNTVPDSDELAQIIRKSFEENSLQKENTKVIREKAIEAVTAGGKSSMDLEGLVKELKKIGLPKA